MGHTPWGTFSTSEEVEDEKKKSLPLGWECPKCGSVWSPRIFQCFNCSGGSDIKITITEVTSK